MTTRFSEKTDPAILGLLPRPYPDSLNMGLSMFAYTYAVTGVRREREGNIGPALIDIGASKRSEEHTSELQSLMRISYAVFCLKKKKQKIHELTTTYEIT